MPLQPLRTQRRCSGRQWWLWVSHAYPRSPDSPPCPRCTHRVSHKGEQEERTPRDFIVRTGRSYPGRSGSSRGARCGDPLHRGFGKEDRSDRLGPRGGDPWPRVRESQGVGEKGLAWQWNGKDWRVGPRWHRACANKDMTGDAQLSACKGGRDLWAVQAKGKCVGRKQCIGGRILSLFLFFLSYSIFFQTQIFKSTSYLEFQIPKPNYIIQILL
jgi:hypothetical protein